jgi:hypothetical protein
MTGTLTIKCPKCQKVMQVPAVLGGKRIRCRGCNTTISVPMPAGAKAAAAPKPGAQHYDEEWEEAKPYSIIKDTDKARCPFCANDVEEGQVLCLKCGYNLRTRERHGTQVIHPVTGGDYTLWLLPGFICVLLVFACIAWIAILWTGVPRLGDAAEYLQDWRWGKVYGTVFALFVGFFSARFAVKRLFLNPHPPEVEKHAHEELDEDDDDFEEEDDEEDEEDEDDDEDKK